MESSFTVPVETILKVDENDLLVEDDRAVSPSNPSPTDLFMIDTQCDSWKVESAQSDSLLLVDETQGQDVTTVNANDNLVEDKNTEEMSFAVREWPLNVNSLISNPKIITSNIAQPMSYNFPTLPIDDKFFLQFDYKTRNKLKTKQRRLDPFYRSQERVRQRTVMRIKRQDPGFRAAEREKGRYRMRIKRLDPEFRSQERERQRERMKVKRSDPDFREKEREQQKTRLYEKRLDPAFKEKERAQERLRMCIKRQNNGSYSTKYSDKSTSALRNASMVFVTENQSSTDDVDLCNNPIQTRDTQAAFPENINNKTLLLKCTENKSAVEAFHLKKQRIFNFNFYNSSNEQWTAHKELCSKSITFVRVSEQNETLKSSLKNDITHDETSSISKDTVVKSEKLSEIKDDLPLISQQQSFSKPTGITTFCTTLPCDG